MNKQEKIESLMQELRAALPTTVNADEIIQQVIVDAAQTRVDRLMFEYTNKVVDVLNTIVVKK